MGKIVKVENASHGVSLEQVGVYDGSSPGGSLGTSKPKRPLTLACQPLEFES